LKTGPDLSDIGPPPPGTKELRAIAPLLAAGQVRRRWPWWCRAGLWSLALGAGLGGLGLWLMARDAAAVLAAERAAGAAPGVVRAGFEPLDLGPRDAAVAVLLVHGFRSSPADFGALPERLAARGVRVVAPLLPGHGTCSEELAETPSEAWVESVRRVHDELADQHAEVRVCGFSMGAAASLVALADTPPGRLALVAPFFGVTPRWYAPPSVETWARIGAHLLDDVDTGPTIRGVRDQARAARFPFYRVLPTRAALEAFELGAAARDPAVLARQTGSVLSIVSDGDTIADPAAAERAHAHFPGPDARLERVAASDHVLLWDHDAERVADMLVTFLTTP
jgi:carboxylesterase